MEHTTTIYESALSYISGYYESLTQGSSENEISILRSVAKVSIKIAEKEMLKGRQLEHALLASCFRYAGSTGVILNEHLSKKLLVDFIAQVGYSQEDFAIVQAIIAKHVAKTAPSNIQEQVVWDALSYRLAMDDFLLNENYQTAEKNISDRTSYDELDLLNQIRDEFSGEHFYTDYAKRKYSKDLTRNYNKLNKRIQTLSRKFKTQEKELR